MREVNEMYLGLNTLRDRFGIGPLIKNHSEGELMWSDGVEAGDSLGAPAAQGHPETFRNSFTEEFFFFSRQRSAGENYGFPPPVKAAFYLLCLRGRLPPKQPGAAEFSES